MIPKLDSKFRTLEAYRAWFSNLSAAGIDPLVPLGADEWSIAEVVEHLVLAEQFMVQALERSDTPKARSSFLRRIRKGFVRFVLTSGIKVPVPSSRVAPSGGRPLAESLEAWSSLRKKLETILGTKTEEDLSKLGFDHPRAGQLDIGESLDFAGYHLAYHKRRAEALLSRH